MLFTFHFNESLDFTQFRRQATHYVSTFPEITYHINLDKYKVVFTSKKQDKNFEINFSISQIIRDKNRSVIDGTNIIPLSDFRFQDLRDIVSYCAPQQSNGLFKTDNVESVIDFMCRMIKTVNKTGKLSVYS